MTGDTLDQITFIGPMRVSSGGYDFPFWAPRCAECTGLVWYCNMTRDEAVQAARTHIADHHPNDIGAEEWTK